MRIYIDDVRKAGHCVKGARRWCNLNGVDFKGFLKEGVDVENLPADSIVDKVVAHKKDHENG